MCIYRIIQIYLHDYHVLKKFNAKIYCTIIFQLNKMNDLFGIKSVRIIDKNLSARRDIHGL